MLLRNISASTTSPRLPESEISECVTSWLRARPSARSREYAHDRLPAMVLISPLWATTRNGWTLSHDDRVLVEKRR